jgi:hypothetical protein
MKKKIDPATDLKRFSDSQSRTAARKYNLGDTARKRLAADIRKSLIAAIKADSLLNGNTELEIDRLERVELIELSTLREELKVFASESYPEILLTQRQKDKIARMRKLEAKLN